MGKREFTLAEEYRYDRKTPLRWIGSHILRYAYLPLGMVFFTAGSNVLMSYTQIRIGDAFRWIDGAEPVLSDLLRIAVTIVIARLMQGLLGLVANGCSEFLAQRLEFDARDELYVSLLGKSLTFHGRQRVGDLMARATNDVRQLNFMISPGLSLILESLTGIVVPLITIATIRAELLAVPLVFTVLLVVTLRDYTLKLNPVSDALRQKFGDMNAILEETISGIEVVKVNAQEKQEEAKFGEEARRFRDLFVRQGQIQAKYWPFLVFGFAYAGALLHALLIYMRGDGLGVGDIIAYMGVFGLLRFPTFISLFSFAVVQMGISGAERILSILNVDTELGQNEEGVAREMVGEVAFEGVSFGYEGGQRVLEEITFRAAPGETIAIVGATGSGKTTLTRLINRVYDVRQGRVLVDGVDVRDWNLESLRGQIGAIEQDVFLFSRSVAENIAFGVGQRASQEEIERCAKEAQAHAFIMSFAQGYDTEVGERGVTLSGGQRQRIAIARAFLADPRILILDDSTSAIDSATEDEIQKAMYRVQQGRTTFLITHRLSQIRWADRVLVLQRGRLVDQGTHEELMRRCVAYRRIFVPYDLTTAPGS
ncbi:MAG: ABC transporter ATP-binding protein [Anaerolineae bacterium]|nr:ABC transporter ATP-binding protein [Anaerolineae bacterium]